MHPPPYRPLSPLALPAPALTTSDRWIFTVPYYTEADEHEIGWRISTEPNVLYGVVGIQDPLMCGFLFLKEPRTLAWMNRLFRADFEVALYPSYYCVAYCRSFGDYHELGSI